MPKLEKLIRKGKNVTKTVIDDRMAKVQDAPRLDAKGSCDCLALAPNYTLLSAAGQAGSRGHSRHSRWCTWSTQAWQGMLMA